MNSIYRNFLPKTRNFLMQIRADHSKLDNASHKVNNLERRFLVWTGKFKTLEEVPTFVQQNVIERARNRMRIRIANYMMAATIVGCIAMAIAGKQAAKRGESVQQQNLDWHRQINEDSKKN